MTGSAICGTCAHGNRFEARYCENCGTRLARGDGATTVAGRTVELRNGTFLFCDLVQSTRLTTRLNADDLVAVFRTYRNTVAKIAAANNGRVIRIVGDGAFVSFGYPEASEDTAEYAVRTGLQLVQAVRNLSPAPGVTLDVRVGVASGTVVMGELINEAAIAEESVIGSAPHLAARLVVQAPIGGVLVSDSTKNRAGGFFEYEDMGTLELKGFDEPVRAFRVLKESEVASRFEAKRDRGTGSQLVGRSEKLQELLQCWQQARTGHGAAVLIRGEAGIGKSRLARAVRDVARDDGATILDIDCTPRAINTPLYPIATRLRRLVGINVHGDRMQARESLQQWLLSLFGSERVNEVMRYLEHLLELESATTSWSESPDRIRERTIAVLGELIQKLAAQRPLFILCEDAQWADATTLMLLAQLGRDIAQLPALNLTTVRTGADAKPIELPGYLDLTLFALNKRDSESVVQLISSSAPLDPATVERIVIRADGNPLFLEEMTRALLETDSDGASAMNKAALSSDVPFTLRTFVQARLDRLPKAKPIAQAAAVLGREFSLPLLQAVLEHSEDVSDELMRLVEREVLAPGPDRAAAVYQFKHALIQDAVYQTMLGNDRQRLHSRTADILVEQFAGRPESVPGILAHHLAMALRYADAASCLVQASATTAARAAYLESIGHARAGLGHVDKLQDTRQQRPLKRQLLTQLAIALAATSGYAAPEVEATYQQAAGLCEENDDPAAVFPIVRGLGTFYFVRCNLLNADAVSLQCIELAKQAQRPDFLIEAMSFRGYTGLYLGRIAEGREALEECVRLYREHSGERFQYPSAQDAGTAAWSLLGIAAWLQGDTRRSDEAVAEALAHADRLGRTFDKAYAHVWIAMLRNMQRRFEEAAQHALACVEICSRDGFNTWLVAATMHNCISNCCRSAAPEAISTLQQALGAFIQAGAEANAPFFLWGIAHGHRYTGDLDNARSSLAEAKQRARATSELYLQSELLILEAEFDADPGRARVLLHEALLIAESQGAVVLALRAAIGLLDPRFGERTASPLLHSARQALEGRGAYPQEHDWAVQALDEAKSMMTAAA